MKILLTWRTSGLLSQVVELTVEKFQTKVSDEMSFNPNFDFASRGSDLVSSSEFWK